MHGVFVEFEKISCLRLNLPKTVIAPLWPSTINSIRNMLSDDFPQWSRAGPVLNRCYLSRRHDAITAVAALARQTDSGQVILFSRSLAIRNSDRWIITVVVAATASIS